MASVFHCRNLLFVAESEVLGLSDTIPTTLCRVKGLVYMSNLTR